MKQKLQQSQKSPGVRTVWRTSAKRTASSLAESTNTWRPSPCNYRTAKRGRDTKISPLQLQDILPDESIWWKKAAPSKMMSCQVASDPERNQAHPRCWVPPESPMQWDTPAYPQRKPQVHLQLQPDPTEWNSSTSLDVFVPQAWDTELPSMQSSGLQSDWGTQRLCRRPGLVLTEDLTRLSEFHLSLYPLQGRPRQKSPSLVVFKSILHAYCNSS